VLHHYPTSHPQVEKINKDKVIILSVVGAFRTGKSHLLDFFLRYLRWSEDSGETG
jgi:hypothetical protein